MSGDEAQETEPENGGRWRPLAWLLAFAILAAHFASFDIREQSIVTDARYYLYFAWRMAEGVSPHISAFDPKTQLATMAGASFYGLGGAENGLLAVRIGWLVLAGCGGVLAFEVHRRLSRSAWVGLIGVLAYCGFGLIGGLAAIGNAPKLITGIAASWMALCVHRRSWVGAGLAGMVGFLDWQIGALVFLVAAFAALLFAERRLRALLLVGLGGAIALAPYLVYFALKGSLAEAWSQTVLAALARGEAFVGQRTFSEHMAHVAKRMRVATGAQEWLFYTSFFGVPLALLRSFQWRGDARLRLLLPLLLLHLGIATFSAIDFQGRGDASILLHGSAFFLALTWGALWTLGARLARRPKPALAFGVLGIAGLTIAARPAWLRPELRISTNIVGKDVTLSDQREVARQLKELVGERTLLVLQHSELLLLLQHVNPGPAIYWNSAVADHVGDGDEAALLTRLIDETGAEAVLFFSPRNSGRLGQSWREQRLSSANGAYEIRVELKK